MSELTATDDSLIVLSICVALGVAFYFIRSTLDRKRNRTALNDPVVLRSGHNWHAEPWMNRGHYCSMCEQPLSGGYTCSLCRLRVDESTCLHLASKTIPCKVNSSNTSTRILKHHWVFGNLEPDDFCAVCEEPCGEELGLSDFWCAWCDRAVHTDCKRQLADQCDRGILAQSVIPPNAIVLRKAGSRNQREMVIESIAPPEDVRNFRPIFVIVNPKSGSGAGENVAKAFRTFLHPNQVVDVTKSNMRTTLRWMDENPQVHSRILIAGGDGTISLVLDDVDDLVNRPAVAVLPLGTGNDLSRVLGWGDESDGREKAKELLKAIQHADVQKIDRWTVHIENTRRIGLIPGTRSLSMTNYVSIGVDACVTFGMQTTRESLPRALSSRLLNKILFFTYGTKDIFSRACKNLETKIELELDGVKQKLKEMEGLVFLNIPYWGAGVKVWNDAESIKKWPQKVDDGKFEVFSVSSSFHIAKLQIGLSSAEHIGQASTATLRIVKGPLPMQSDGEAWMQVGATVTITNKGMSTMLKRAPIPHSNIDLTSEAVLPASAFSERESNTD